MAEIVTKVVSVSLGNIISLDQHICSPLLRKLPHAMCVHTCAMSETC